MNENYTKIREFLFELEITIVSEDNDNGIFVIQKEDDGIMNMIVAVADPVLILEQPLFDVKNESLDLYKTLLMKNRDIIHGAIVLDNEGKKVLYRDTLELKNIDINELEASIESVSLLLSEFGQEIINFAK
ncbi:MAG: molecular chaperone Tir [Bacteroidota bacterium]|nr:molecular chaperone Tir [Bacteroidota bacterium]